MRPIPLFSLVIFLCLATRSFSQPVPKTLTGYSGNSLEQDNIPREIYGVWMGRSNWDDLRKGNWLMVEESGVPRWRREHFERALDVGVPLIPTDMHEDYNALLREAISGRRDDVYAGLGRALAQYGSKTVFARLWWEFNMHPVQQDPALFVQAWKRAVPLIRKAFAGAASAGQRLQIVWCTNAGAPDPEPFYPGDDVVDIIGSDTYGMVWGKKDPGGAQMLKRIRDDPFMLKWQAAFANRHRKPTCIGEWGNVARKGQTAADDMHGLGDYPAYIDALYDWTKTCTYGCVYLCYFNLPDGGIATTLSEQPQSRARLQIRAGEH